MTPPLKEEPIWWRRISKYLAYFLLGASFGGAIMLFQLGNQIDELYALLQQRNNELKKIADERDYLEEQLSAEQKVAVIQGIDLNLLERKDHHLNKVTREMIKAEVYQWLKGMNIIGEPVEHYQKLPQFFRETMNHHKITLDQEDYELMFDAVAIGTRVRIWFFVREAASDVVGW